MYNNPMDAHAGDGELEMVKVFVPIPLRSCLKMELGVQVQKIALPRAEDLFEIAVGKSITLALELKNLGVNLLYT